MNDEQKRFYKMMEIVSKTEMSPEKRKNVMAIMKMAAEFLDGERK